MRTTLKRTIRRVMNRAGYNVTRINAKGAPNDDIILRVGGFPLLMNGDHHLSTLLARYPGYSSHIARIAKHMVRFYPDLSLIDIGANVGDTVALVKSVVDIPIICVEGDKTYYSYLKRNIEQFRNVQALNCFLGDSVTTITGEFVRGNGTLHIDPKGNEQIELETLDHFLQLAGLNGVMKILKIDTDGYDTRILRGGANFIAEYKPVIVFEYDSVTQLMADEKGLDGLASLRRSGYDLILFYDSVGRFICSSRLDMASFVNQMDAYISGRQGLIPYYDVCLFHETDSEIGNELIEIEMCLSKNSGQE